MVKLSAHTGTKENNGFEVGIFIRVWGKLGHAVTELLHPPYVLHYHFYPLWGQLFCTREKNKSLEDLPMAENSSSFQ